MTTKFKRVQVTLDKDSKEFIEKLSKNRQWSLSQTIMNLVKIGMAFSPDIRSRK